MHTNSNFFGKVPHPSEYKVPRTKERFWLLKNYPAIYEKYTAPKPWER